MQSDNGSPFRSEGLEASIPPTILPVGDVFAITQQDASILEEYIDDFQEGNADVQNTIIANVMAELSGLHPETFAFNKVEASKVFLYIVMLGAHKLIFYPED